MKVIGIKLQKAGLIMMSVWSILGMFSCEDRFDTPRPSTGDGKPVEVTLSVGFADEEDAVSPGAGSSATKATASGGKEGFDVRLVPASRTKADDALATDKPQKLYNLQVLQYEGSNLKTVFTVANSENGIDVGSSLTLTLNASDDCRLIFVARGRGKDGKGTIPAFGDNTPLSNLQSALADSSVMKNLRDIDNMPYILDLPHVKVKDGSTIQSLDGRDVRVLLKRLAARLTVTWVFDNNSEAMRNYTLKEVRLCQVPSTYRVFPQTENATGFGTIYPISTVEYKDLYRLKGTDALASGSNEGTKTVWLPANAKGNPANVTSPYYRTKNYAHSAATYMEFVVDNAVDNERLYYRAYLGGENISDFNLLENTNYNYTISISGADYRNDPRIQLLDQTPVISTNLVPTANCFMMRPGTNICFNPYLHEAGSGGWNTYLTTSGTINSGKQISSVRVLWQSKDAGTSGDLVMGYAVSNEEGEYNHQNLVNYEKLSSPTEARVHVKVPVTQGGNAVIAAYNTAEDGTETIVWSWHLWISDYMPARMNTNGITSEDTRKAAVQAARTASVGGSVHQYRGDAWQYNPTATSRGKYYNQVIMDRNLGALRNTWSEMSSLESARAYGSLYQWGRKDPLPGSADGSKEDIDLMFDADGVSLTLTIAENSAFNSYEDMLRNPTTFYKTKTKSYDSQNAVPQDSWKEEKTIYDPCPNGWKVPYFTNTNSPWSDFKEFGTDKIDLLINGNWKKEQSINVADFHVMNGLRYKLEYEDGDKDKDGNYAWFPFLRMRNSPSGLLRDAYYNAFGEKLDRPSNTFLPAFFVYSAAASNSKNAYYIEFKCNIAPNLDLTGNQLYGFGVRCIQDNK